MFAVGQSDSPNATLKVHGGCGTLTGDLSAHPDLTLLDSHILGAAPRARLTPEEKLEREVSRRRELELERRARIFDAKRRTIGVDKEALDAQVAEKEAQREEERRNRHLGDKDTLEIDRQLKIAEAEKIKQRFLLEKESRDFSLTNCRKDQSREFDLNDKLANRKGIPARVGDNDPRCGPASLQKFSGEDLMKEERIKQQQRQLRNIIEQQKFEKAMLAEVDDGAELAKEHAEMVALRNEIEANEVSLRKELQIAQRNANLDRAAERKQQIEDRRREELQRDAAEIRFHATDPFLNEFGNDRTATGAARRSEYKGATKDEKVQGRIILEEQAAEQASHRMDEKIQDKIFTAQVDATRRHLILVEREKQRAKRAVVEQVAQENLKLKTQHLEKSKALNELYTNRFSDEFFEQFGKGCR